MNDFEQLRARTKEFAVRMVKTIDALPSRRSTDVLSRQALRSATSIGANYREACRARSKAEFVAKIHTVQEEADETQYWLELLHEAGAMSDEEYGDLHQEASELTAIFTASEKTARHSSAAGRT